MKLLLEIFLVALQETLVLWEVVALVVVLVQVDVLGPLDVVGDVGLVAVAGVDLLGVLTEMEKIKISVDIAFRL